RSDKRFLVSSITAIPQQENFGGPSMGRPDADLILGMLRFNDNQSSCVIFGIFCRRCLTRQKPETPGLSQ
ncbi:MAG TPA: hypothetical protein VF671_19045, partial [Pseudomonas sp.]|uniref:hypothetical protein n=1 Tax=Pseudomonas sp. TaxID=306 RepID=UPI002ED8ACBE